MLATEGMYYVDVRPAFSVTGLPVRYWDLDLFKSVDEMRKNWGSKKKNVLWDKSHNFTLRNSTMIVSGFTDMKLD